MPRRPTDPDDDDLEHDDAPTVGGSSRSPLRRDELPDDADFTDDNDDGTDPCPYCGADIYADGEWCPKCGKYLVEEEAPSPRGWWVAAVLVAVLLAMLIITLTGR